MTEAELRRAVRELAKIRYQGSITGRPFHVFQELHADWWRVYQAQHPEVDQVRIIVQELDKMDAEMDRALRGSEVSRLPAGRGREMYHRLEEE